MNRTDGSYQFDRFDGDIQTQERRRLNDRARVLQSLDRKILEMAGLTPTMQVLDLGCGTGRLSIEIAEFLTSGKVVGIDRSAGMILAARSAIDCRSIANLTFHESNSENIDLPDSICDFVYARLLFQHLSEPQLTLAEIQRVLKPGGIVCIVDVDDNLTMFYPPIASMSAFQQQFDRIQTQQGGDSQVGRKLGTYLAAAGFDRIKTAIEMVTSDALRSPLVGEVSPVENRSPTGMKTFLDLLSFGAAFEHQNPELIPLAIQFKRDAYKLVDLPYAWGCFGLFVVTGVKLINCDI
jgi:ubiquinone/menaquinone biosynthesis C-methylase UbiE